MGGGGSKGSFLRLATDARVTNNEDFSGSKDDWKPGSEMNVEGGRFSRIN